MEKVNLVPAINEIKRIIQQMTDEYTKAIKPYQDSLIELRKLNDTCEMCEGKGWIIVRNRSDLDDQRDHLTCPFCCGTGKAKKEKVS